MLTIATLVQERIHWQEDLLSIQTKKAEALFLFLCIEHCFFQRSVHRREYLADLFWPDLDRHAALNNLRQSLHHIRAACKGKACPVPLLTNRSTVCFSKEIPIWCDLQALSTDSVEGLLQLPNGALRVLPNTVLYDAHPFQEWLEVVQVEVDRRADRSFLEAIDQACNARNWLQVEALITNYLSRTSGSFTLLEQLATANAKQGKWAQAEHWLEQAGYSRQRAEEWMQHFQAEERLYFKRQIYTPAADALAYYLQAWSVYAKATAKTTNEAVQLFRRATEIDPGFARAFLGLATAISTQGSWWGDQQMQHLLPEYEAAIIGARQDPTLEPEIEAVMGWTKLWLWELHSALEHFQHATEVTSSTSYGWTGLVHSLNLLGRFEEAEWAAQHAINKDPHFTQNYICLAETAMLRGEYERGEQICRLALKPNPDYQPGLTVWMWALTEMGRAAEAIQLAEASFRRSGLRPYYHLGRLANAYLETKNETMATRYFQQMEEAAARGEKGYPYFMALHLHRLGKTSEAFDVLEQYQEEYPTDYLWLNVQPEFRSLHDQPRFRRLLDRVMRHSSSRLAVSPPARSRVHRR